FSSLASAAWLRAAVGFGEDLRKPVGEANLTIVLGLVADDLLGIDDAPEAVAVAADAVEDLEGDAVLVPDIRGFDRFHEELDLISDAQVGAETAMQRLEIVGAALVDVGLARAADADLDVFEPLAVALIAGREDESQVLV